MVDQFENSAILFKGKLANEIKNRIRTNLQNIQGSTERLEGYDRANFLLSATKLTGLELKALQHYIDTLPRNQQGIITNPAYNLIGGDALNTFIKKEIARLRHQINSADALEKELGKTEKQDITPPAPPNLEATTGLPRLGLELNEQVTRIKQLIHY